MSQQADVLMETGDAAPPLARPREIAVSFGYPGLWTLLAILIVVAGVAQYIGPFSIPVGNASIVMLPMIWALLLGVLVSGQRIKPLPIDLQHIANALVNVAVLVLCARLSFTLGGQLPALFKAGPALLLQELGNVFGSILLALPLAVLLRMGPATVGATFSIDREPSFAMVTSRFGADSPQYRGVLSMYVFGSVFGAIIVSLVASIVSAMNIFDYRALAMGAGVGSGSMMAAGIASITASHPEQAEAIAALAATANLIAGLAGLYLALYVSLPLADHFYRFLTRNQTERKTAVANKMSAVAAQVLDAPKVNLPNWMSLLILSGAGLIMAVIAKRGFSFDMVLTYIVMAGMVAFSLWLAAVTKGRILAIITVITLGGLATVPGMPTAQWLTTVPASVDFLSVITLMLAAAGLSIGKDLPMLKEIGWKILPVGFVVIAATFLASTVIAQFVLGIIG